MGADGEIMGYKNRRFSAVLAVAEKPKKEKTEKLDLAFMLPVRGDKPLLQMDRGSLGSSELTVYS